MGEKQIQIIKAKRKPTCTSFKKKKAEETPTVCPELCGTWDPKSNHSSMLNKICYCTTTEQTSEGIDVKEDEVKCYRQQNKIIFRPGWDQDYWADIYAQYNHKFYISLNIIIW